MVVKPNIQGSKDTNYFGGKSISPHFLFFENQYFPKIGRSQQSYFYVFLQGNTHIVEGHIAQQAINIRGGEWCRGPGPHSKEKPKHTKAEHATKHDLRQRRGGIFHHYQRTLPRDASAT